MTAIRPEFVASQHPGYVYRQAPRNVYWETTRACDLACRHCRADAHPERDSKELSTGDAMALMRDVSRMGSMMILTGGDPMKRPDLFELMEYGRKLHLPMAITPSTTPTLTLDVVEKFARLGVSALGLSIDGPTAEVHDGFRGIAGTFDCSMRALEWARELEIPVQINTTVCTDTLPHLKELYRLLAENAAPPVRRWSLFLLVPVGRGETLGLPSTQQVEELFDWVYRTSSEAPFHVGTVEAPHYRRFWIQRQLSSGATSEEIAKRALRMGFGVRDGNGVIFVSHTGDVFPAGFLPHPRIGNVRRKRLSLMYRNAPALNALRDADKLRGRCGRCAFKWACGGSRARAYAMTGDVLGDDPLCAYEP